MALKLYGHPLSSFCWKALIALYEIGVDFDFEVLDLSDPDVRARFARLSPLGKMPVLEDGGRAVLESTIIIEHLALRFPEAGLVPAEPEAALEVRALDRFFDSYCHLPMQRLVALKLRPPGNDDPFGVRQGRGELKAFYAAAEARLAGRAWAAGEAFTLADCAAAPALHYANKIEPLTDFPGLARYLGRLEARPSFAWVLAEAQPFAHFFPGAPGVD